MIINYIYILLISFLVSLSVYYKLNPVYNYLKWFPPFLLLTLVIEYIGIYLASHGRNNLFLYNFFTAFEFCFYNWVLSMVIVNPKMKKAIRIAVPIYAVVAVANILFYQGINQWHNITYALGALMVVICCIYYFFELFKFPTSVRLKNTPVFWISSGLLFFYCCGLPFYGLSNYWIGIPKWLLNNFTYISTFLNIFLYSLFTIAFLCIRTRKYTLLPS